MKSRSTVYLIIIVVFFIGLFIFRQKSAVPKSVLSVVTTFPPIYVFTINVARDLAEVTNIISNGQEAHEYVFTPGDAALIADADIVVKNGLGFDYWIDQAIKTAGRTSLIVIDASSRVDVTKPGLQSKEIDSASAPVTATINENKIPARSNPHIWVNPAYAVHMVEAIRDGFIKADAVHANEYARNAEEYLARLMELDGEIHAELLKGKSYKYVAEEPSMTYFAREYGLTEIATIESALGTPLSARQLSALQARLKREGIRVIFKNARSESTLIETFARDTDAIVYEFDPFETGPLNELAYEETMRSNLETIKKAFSK